jgi:hypothetical protein
MFKKISSAPVFKTPLNITQEGTITLRKEYNASYANPLLTANAAFAVEMPDEKWAALPDDVKVKSILRAIAENGFVELARIQNSANFYQRLLDTRNVYDFSTLPYDGLLINSNLRDDILRQTGLCSLKTEGLHKQPTSLSYKQEILRRNELSGSVPHEDGLIFHILGTFSPHLSTEFIPQENRQAFLDVLKSEFEQFRYQNQSLVDLGVKFDEHILSVDPGIKGVKMDAWIAFREHCAQKLSEPADERLKPISLSSTRYASLIMFAGRAAGSRTDPLIFSDGRAVSEEFELKPLIHRTPVDCTTQQNGLVGPRVLYSLQIT